MTRELLLLGTVIGALGFLTPAYADTVWNFSTPGGDQGTSHPYVSDGLTITATAFGPAGTPQPHLIGKGLGGDETGLGLSNDPTPGETEITPGSFIQLDISKVPFPITSFQADSTTNGETWNVFGGNTSGVLGTMLLATCTAPAGSGSGNTCELLKPINSTGFSFLDVTAGTGNVLLTEVNAVAAPVVGVGLPGLAAACGGLLILARRRRQKIG
jgi:hypothetical protein